MVDRCFSCMCSLFFPGIFSQCSVIFSFVSVGGREWFCGKLVFLFSVSLCMPFGRKGKFSVSLWWERLAVVVSSLTSLFDSGLLGCRTFFFFQS